MTGAQGGFALLTVVIFLSLLGFALMLLRDQGSGLNVAMSGMTDDAALDYALAAAETHAGWELKAKGCDSYQTVTGMLGNTAYSATFSASTGSPVDVALKAKLASGAIAQTVRGAQRSLQTTEVTEVTVTRATYIRESAAAVNYGGTVNLKVGGLDGDRHRILLQGFFGEISTDDDVLRAELIMTATGAAGGTDRIVVRRLLQAWEENQASWNDGSTGEAWDEPGGSAAIDHYAVFSVPAAGPVAVNITSLVRAWINGAQNHGLLLEFLTPRDDEVVFDSDDADSISIRVYHACECGLVCAPPFSVQCDANFRANTERGALPLTLSPDGFTTVPGGAQVMGVTFPSEGGVIAAAGLQLRAYDYEANLLGSCGLLGLGGIDGLTFTTTGPDGFRLAVLSSLLGITQVQYIGANCAVTGTWIPSGSDLGPATGVAFVTMPGGEDYEHHTALADASGRIEIFDAEGDRQKSIEPDITTTATTGLTHIPNQERFLLVNNATQEIYNLNFDGAVGDRYDFTRFGGNAGGGIAIDFATCDHVFAQSSASVANRLYHHVLSVMPIAHWKLDDLQGGDAEDAIGDHKGDLHGGPVWMADGAVQGSLRFDGTNRVQVHDEPELRFTEEVSVAGWVYADRVDGQHGLLAKDHLSEYYGFGIEAGFASMRYNDGATGQVYAPVSLNTGQWYHLAFSYSSLTGAARIYVNGSLVHTVPVANPLATNTDDLEIGTAFEGRLDDIYLFGGEISPADVQLLYAEGLPGGGSGGGTGGGSGDCTANTYRDQFDTVAFDGTNGSIDWLDPWLEIGESNGAALGDVRVTIFGDRRLQMRDNDNGGEGVSRRMDLSGYATAELTFDYARLDLAPGEFVSVSVIQYGDETELTRLEFADGTGTDDPDNMRHAVFSLDAYAGGAAELRFITSSNMAATHGAYIDNVQIEMCP